MQQCFVIKRQTCYVPLTYWSHTIYRSPHCNIIFHVRTIYVVSYDIRFVNSSNPGSCGNNFGSVISKSMLRIKFLSTPCDVALMWKPNNTFEDKSTLVQVRASCHQTPSKYTSHCRPISKSPYGVPQWVNRRIWLYIYNICLHGFIKAVILVLTLNPPDCEILGKNFVRFNMTLLWDLSEEIFQAPTITTMEGQGSCYCCRRRRTWVDTSRTRTALISVQKSF